MTARIIGMESIFGSCKIGTSASSAMELVSDAKDGVMRNESTVGPMQKSPSNFTMQMDGEFMNSPSFASFPIIPEIYHGI